MQELPLIQEPVMFLIQVFLQQAKAIGKWENQGLSRFLEMANMSQT